MSGAMAATRPASGAYAGNQAVLMPDSRTQIYASGVARMPLSTTLAWRQIGGYMRALLALQHGPELSQLISNYLG
jgi:hypothetical protein